MKTKLSFLALPWCLGLVLTFVLAACTEEGNKGGEVGGTSSSAGAITNPSSEVKNDSILIDGFGTASGGPGRVDVVGKIYGTVAVPVVKLEFAPPSWFSYDPDFPITLPSDYISLGNRVYIDLANPSIGSNCGTQNITLKACADAACNTFATKNGTFERPQSYCNSSSSEAALSSSSEAVWIFGPPTSIPDVPLNVSVTIGSGSFRLAGDEGQPNITVTGGTVRATGLSAMGVDDTPVVGTPYSSKENFLGSRVPTSSTYGNDDEGVQNKDYLLIYFGSTIYLLRLEAKPGFPWPQAKQGTYWPATEHP